MQGVRVLLKECKTQRARILIHFNFYRVPSPHRRNSGSAAGCCIARLEYRFDLNTFYLIILLYLVQAHNCTSL